MEIHYTADGINEVMDTLSDWTQQLDRGDRLSEVSEVILQAVMENYRQQRDARSWPPRKHDYSWPMLVKTGKKRQTELTSITENWQKTGTGFEKKIETTDYGVYHHTGTKRLPARQSVYFSDRVIDKLHKIVQKIFGPKATIRIEGR